MHCCLSEKAKYEHDHARPEYTKKLYIAARLFGGRPICVWCYLHITEMIKPAYTENDSYHLEQMKKCFPNYWAAIESEGLDIVRREIGCQLLEVEPDSTPTTIQQNENYPRLKTSVEGAKGGYYGT